MSEQVIAVTVVVVGMIIMVCKHSWIKITNEVRDKAYKLTKGVLALYLLDLILLAGFGIPFPGLHDCTLAGIAVSVIILLIVVFNLTCEYSGIQLEADAGNAEQWGLDYILGFGVSVLWFFVEITGIMLKIRP